MDRSTDRKSQARTDGAERRGRDLTIPPEDRARAIAARVGDLPTLPQVATKILQAVRDPTSTAKRLEQILATDQALTGKVLRIANSAFFGMQSQVTTLGRAIVVLGFNTLRSMVLTSVSNGLFRAGRSCFKDLILWEHSLAAALAARTIARHCAYPDPEAAYITGLLHDIGKVVLDANLPDQYQQVIERVYNEGETFVSAENEILGFDHTEVGALVVQRWSLTERLEEAVRLHHKPTDATIDPTLCALTSLANRICITLAIGPERNPGLQPADGEPLLRLSAPELDRIATTVKERLVEEKSLVGMA